MNDITILIQNYITAHKNVNITQKEEEQYLNQIIDLIQSIYPEADVNLSDGYITISYFTIIGYEDISPLLELGITNFHIDTHIGVKSGIIHVPEYYHKLVICIDIDSFQDITED